MAEKVARSIHYKPVGGLGLSCYRSAADIHYRSRVKRDPDEVRDFFYEPMPKSSSNVQKVTCLACLSFLRIVLEVPSD